MTGVTRRRCDSQIPCNVLLYVRVANLWNMKRVGPDIRDALTLLWIERRACSGSGSRARGSSLRPCVAMSLTVPELGESFCASRFG
jgi:hypothetical protein